jgi:hypothetical protein
MRNYEPKLLRVSHNYDVEVLKKSWNYTFLLKNLRVRRGIADAQEKQKQHRY